MNKYIGSRRVKGFAEKDNLVYVSYDDGSKETLSKLMYDKILSDEPCDLTTLREKRIFPVVEEVLKVLRNWGIKLNELGFMSAVLNRSLEENEKAALKELWRTRIPDINSHEDVDLITIDNVLKNKLSPYVDK